MLFALLLSGKSIPPAITQTCPEVRRHLLQRGRTAMSGRLCSRADHGHDTSTRHPESSSLFPRVRRATQTDPCFVFVYLYSFSAITSQVPGKTITKGIRHERSTDVEWSLKSCSCSRCCHNLNFLLSRLFWLLHAKQISDSPEEEKTTTIDRLTHNTQHIYTHSFPSRPFSLCPDHHDEKFKLHLHKVKYQLT